MKPNEDELKEMVKFAMLENKDVFPPEQRAFIDDIIKSVNVSMNDILVLGATLHRLMSAGGGSSTGSQVLISLGQRGILWISSNDYLPNSQSPFSRIDSPTVLNILDQIHWKLFPALPLNLPDKEIDSFLHAGPEGRAAVIASGIHLSASLVTNGAGDAFCGGFIARVISAYDSNESKDSIYSNAIVCGLKAAKTRIKSNSKTILAEDVP